VTLTGSLVNVYHSPIHYSVCVNVSITVLLLIMQTVHLSVLFCCHVAILQ